jgi:hypothetical protein
MGEYGWQRHLIAQGAYADWVDRGRLRPTHRQWSAYLREVAGKAEVEVVPARVVGMEADGERWRLAVEPGEELRADGVVVTGAGPPVRVAGQPHQHSRVLDGRSYWLAARVFSKQMAQNVCACSPGGRRRSKRASGRRSSPSSTATSASDLLAEYAQEGLLRDAAGS